MHPFTLTTIILILLMSVACTDNSIEREADAAKEPQDPVREMMIRFIEAVPGDIIAIPAGTYSLSRSLILNADGVTIKGAGMDETILSFKNQVAGAEGILVNGSNFTIEDSVAIGASDAGLYVGQSRNIIVRGNRAEYNVAGIEIENSVHADVYDNVAVNNTGGILVFNMPDLPQEGHSTRGSNAGPVIGLAPARRQRSGADPAEMMPELGRSLAHKEGVRLVARWIESLEGECSFLRL